MPSSTSCSGTRIPLTDGSRPHLPVLFGAVVFVALTCLIVRGLLPQQESPLFSPAAPENLQISFGPGFPEPGVRQFHDGMTLADAMELTGVAAAGEGRPGAGSEEAGLATGMSVQADDIAGDFKVGWMPARQRLALGIRLHPDRMTLEDWETLPGIGPKLALEIEKDRQINGDYGRFEALERVKGIGPAKLKKLRAYFAEDVN